MDRLPWSLQLWLTRCDPVISNGNVGIWVVDFELSQHTCMCSSFGFVANCKNFSTVFLIANECILDVFLLLIISGCIS